MYIGERFLLSMQRATGLGLGTMCILYQYALYFLLQKRARAYTLTALLRLHCLARELETCRSR